MTGSGTNQRRFLSQKAKKHNPGLAWPSGIKDEERKSVVSRGNGLARIYRKDDQVSI